MGAYAADALARSSLVVRDPFTALLAIRPALATCFPRNVLPVSTSLPRPSESFALTPSAPTRPPEIDPSAGWIEEGLDRQRGTLPVHLGEDTT